MKNEANPPVPAGLEDRFHRRVKLLEDVRKEKHRLAGRGPRLSGLIGGVLITAVSIALIHILTKSEEPIGFVYIPLFYGIILIISAIFIKPSVRAFIIFAPAISAAMMVMEIEFLLIGFFWLIFISPAVVVYSCCRTISMFPGNRSVRRIMILFAFLLLLTSCGLVLFGLAFGIITTGPDSDLHIDSGWLIGVVIIVFAVSLIVLSWIAEKTYREKDNQSIRRWAGNTIIAGHIAFCLFSLVVVFSLLIDWDDDMMFAPVYYIITIALSLGAADLLCQWLLYRWNKKAELELYRLREEIKIFRENAEPPGAV